MSFVSIAPTESSVMAWLNRGSIVRQARLIFQSISLLVILLGLAAALGFYRAEQRSKRLSDLTTVAFATSGMTRSVTLAKDQMGAYRARGYDPELIAGSISSAKEARRLNHDLKAAAGKIDPKWLPVIDELDVDLAGIKRVLAEVRDAPRSVVETESFLGPRYDAIDTANAKIIALRDDAATRVQSTSVVGLWEIRMAIVAMVGFAVLALLFVFWGQRFVKVRIVSPVTEISETSQRLAKGETDLQIPVYDRDDEIGTMSRSISVMQSFATEALASAELRIAAQSARDDKIALIQKLADTFQTTVGNVAQEVGATSVQLKSAATTLTDFARQSSERVINATRLLEDSSHGAASAASASDEFVLSIHEISRQASTSADRARKASDMAQEMDSTIASLDQTASHISAVVEMIGTIAQRTNMLALNASIEAARGGEAGRGFAVVASEVKELAQQTAKATEDVENQIRQIQASSSASITALRAIAAEVEEMKTASIAIATSVDQQSVAGSELARSIDVAARNTEAVSSDMSEVSRLAVATGTAADQVDGSCRQLGEQAEILRQQVAEFLGHVRAA